MSPCVAFLITCWFLKQLEAVLAQKYEYIIRNHLNQLNTPKILANPTCLSLINRKCVLNK